MKRTAGKDLEPLHMLVYSTEPQKKAPVTAKTPTQFGKLRQRIEKKGRGGKSVTVLFGLPADQAALKELCSLLKKSLGTGGTSYVSKGEGFIEIQGERQEEVAKAYQTYVTTR